MVDLRELGWDDFWESAFQPYRASGLFPTRVVLEDKNAYAVVGEAGEWPARVAGRLLQNTARDAFPKVGDWVAVAKKPSDGRAVIHGLLPRRTVFTRKITGREAAPQVLAANIDIAFIVQALDETFNPRRLERFLVMAHEGGSEAVVVLNKADLCKDLDARLADARAVSGSAKVLILSGKTRLGLGELRRCLAPGRTCAFIGTSGAGKSTLINRLYGEAIQPTLEVREHDSKGRHTTAWREMILLPSGGLVIDTPGMREFQLWHADGGLAEAFPDVAALAVQCHFRACTHTTEKRCAVLQALANGSLSVQRFDSFKKLRQELDRLASARRENAYLRNRRHAGNLRRLAAEEPFE